ncbi:histidine kinase N-terminal domain-containing protein [Robertmurraya sp. FSL R5-0851]|uniref:histidine kinase N-terminal domain-containing protein n=1 Tax=Robertmurraya sp. FSL R5-0851 TaxID=2921584 RepID=UPI0030F7755D
MLQATREKLIDYLSKSKNLLISLWEKEILISTEDPYKIEVNTNDLSLFQMILDGLDREGLGFEMFIEEFSLKMAEQRVNDSINIGTFVYNVNIGRSIIYHHLLESDFTKEEIQESIKIIDSFFDKFLLYSVSYFTEEKNKIIEEKTQFIDSTHKDRLTLLGQMTSSFIHEFRNPLTSVQGFIQLLKAEDPSIKYLDIISSELEQLNFRISQFLLLSKKELIGKEKSSFSLNELIDEVLIFLYPSILDSKVKVIRETFDHVHLFGYVDEIRQVLINIIFNAIDVLTQYREDPTIEIISSLSHNKHVVIEISNNGPMIPDQMLKSIFEPFVTTKTLGTGLGLFVCREIIEKHKGRLICESSKEKTIFRMTMPIPSHTKASE